MRLVLDAIADIPQYRIKTDLVPVLRTGIFFDVKTAQKECIDYLSKLLVPANSEKQFLESFRNKDYRPALLFEDDDILNRIKNHPMAAWKCRAQPPKGIHEQIVDAQRAIQEQKAIKTSSGKKLSDLDR